jgi:hypothetical protein
VKVQLWGVGYVHLQVSRGELVVHDRGSSVFVPQVIIKLVVYVFSDNKVWHLVS